MKSLLVKIWISLNFGLKILNYCELYYLIAFKIIYNKPNFWINLCSKDKSENCLMNDNSCSCGNEVIKSKIYLIISITITITKATIVNFILLIFETGSNQFCWSFNLVLCQFSCFLVNILTTQKVFYIKQLIFIIL